MSVGKRDDMGRVDVDDVGRVSIDERDDVGREGS